MNTELPPLPEPLKQVRVYADHGPANREPEDEVFDAGQMRDYARAAIRALSADRGEAELSPPEFDGSHVGIEDRPDLWPQWVHNVVSDALDTPPSPAESAEGAWRCFHCDEVFTAADAAAEHFGTHERHSAACTIDAAEYRRMVAREERYAEEDADCHRAMRRMQGEHTDALRRAEEAGYAKALKDTGYSESAAPSGVTDAPILPDHDALFLAPPPIEGSIWDMPVGWEYQHGETGRMTVAYNDGVNTRESFERLNPRYIYVGPLYRKPQPGRGEGMVLVPVEPTEAMIDAMLAAEIIEHSRPQSEPISPREAMYRAAIAAAPTASSQEPGHG